MSLRKKVKQLFVYHENTRLLIMTLEERHIVLRNHIATIEQELQERRKING
jgi:hypothetical protein